MLWDAWSGTPDTDAALGQCSSALGDTARKREMVQPLPHPPSFALPVATKEWDHRAPLC